MCRCYGCSIQRQRAGIPAPDRSSDPCVPPGACTRDVRDNGRCWTHSEWIDEAVCDPRNACVRGISCVVHGQVRA